MHTNIDHLHKNNPKMLILLKTAGKLQKNAPFAYRTLSLGEIK